MNLKKFALLLVVAVLALAIAAPVAVAGAQEKVVKIGLYAPMTGPIAFLGEGFQFGATLAIEDLGGEIEGYKLELVVADNKCNPTDAVNAVLKLIEVDQVNVILGGGCSSATVAALPIILEGETPAVSATSTSPAIFGEMGVGGNEWQFRMNPDDLIMAQSFAGFIAERAESIALVAENTDFGRGALAAYKPFFEKEGLAVVSEDYFDLGTADYRPALTRIKAADPEALLIVMTERDGSTFMRQLREVGLTQRIFSRGSLNSPLFLEYTEDDPLIGDGVMEFGFWAAGQDPDQDENFFKRWDRPNSPHRAMSYYATYYVIGNGIRNAIVDYGAPTRENIRKAIAELDIMTPVGPVKFDEHNQAYPFGTVTINEKGTLKFLETVELKPVEGRE